MGKLFDYDGGLMRVLNKILDCLLLSVLWIVFSIPIVTLGASTSALYYTANKVIRHDRSHVWSEFWGAFKSNFKQASVCWLVLAVIEFFVIANCIMFLKVIPNKGLFIFYAVLGFIFCLWGLHMFAQVSRFQNTVGAIMKNSALMMIRHFLLSILELLVLAAGIIVLLMWPLVILIMPAVFMVVTAFIFESIYERYMSQEDLQLEEERNRDFYE